LLIIYIPMLKLVPSYKKRKDISCIAVLVSFNTYDWIVPCLKKFRKHFPDMDILVVDNNPCQGTKRSKTFVGKTVYCTPFTWNKKREEEREWLHSVKDSMNLQIIQTPRCMDHGRAIDFAISTISGYDAFVHIEPDCSVNGKAWMRNLKQKIVDGNWTSSGCMKSSREMHPTPSIWRLVAFSRKVYTGQERLFYQMFDLYRMDSAAQGCWDTGIYASYRCARKGRSSYANTQDLHHAWCGSKRNNPSKSERSLLQKLY